ncbi:MAG: SUMF1/EgtB/PvdO family nonheme iron enzyme [Alphaproteobacteria bacterium]
MAEVFISYARDDFDRVVPIVRAIRNAGYSLWWDQRMDVGASWREAVAQACDGAACVVVVWSAAAARSRWVLRDLSKAGYRAACLVVTLDATPLHRSLVGRDRISLDGWSGDRRKDPWPGIEAALEARIGRPAASWSAGEGDGDLPGIATPVDPHLDGERWFLAAAVAAAALAGGLAAAWLLTQDRPITPRTDFPAPAMVRVAGGTFVMGAETGAEGAAGSASPVHTVRLEAFALARTEVTWAQWQACVSAGGCQGDGPEAAGGDGGWGRGRRPVIHVSWSDAHDYVRWLSGETGLVYRLPTEAEWEFAARAGATTRYAWGNADPVCDATVPSGARFAACPEDGAAPVASFPPNALGLHDMAGNVAEWVEDCFHPDYRDAPTDGSAWVTACAAPLSARMIRGGSWADPAPALEVGVREARALETRLPSLGFRVARSL